MRVKEKEIFGGFYDGGDPVVTTEPEPVTEPVVAQDPQPEPSEETTVPVAVVQELREKLKASEGNNDILTQNNTALTQHIQSQQQPPEQEEPYNGLFKGKDDEDIATNADLKQVMNTVTNTMNTLFTQVGTRLQHDDYESVVKAYLPNVLKQKPHLEDIIRKSGNPMAVAYELAKTDPEYQKNIVTATNQEALKKKLNENAEKSVSINQASGGVQPAGENYLTMKKDKFDDVLAKVLSGAR